MHWGDIFAKLSPAAAEYWGGRCLGQLRYLQAMCESGYPQFTPLLEEAAGMLMDAYQSEGAITKATAARLEAALAPASHAAKSVTVICAAHAHIDMNWMWTFDETVSITLSTVRTMLHLLTEYPTFIFSQSQASVYRIIEDYAPELLPEIRRYIAEGRWEVTASTWVENDKNLSGGESQARHLLYTRQYLKGLLGLTDDQFQIDYEPDTFGHHRDLPTLLNAGGVRYYYHCRGHEEHTLYRWRAPSGAEVVVFRDPTWYLETITADSFLHIPALCLNHNLTQALRVYGVGDHGGGATRRDISRILDMAEWPVMPRLVFGKYIDFFKSLDAATLPVVEHELNFVFDGCYSSQSRIKRANAAAEATLFSAEALGVAAHHLGELHYQPSAFFDAWEKVLFSHFHDILPGSCVIGTREYALGQFQRTMALAGTRKDAAARAIGRSINTLPFFPTTAAPSDSTSEGAGGGFGVSGFSYTEASSGAGMRRVFHVKNPAQFEHEGVVKLTIWDWDSMPERAAIYDETGAALPLQALQQEPIAYWGHRYFEILVRLTLPAFGYRTIYLDASDAWPRFPKVRQPRVIANDPLMLENDQIRAVFDPADARLVSLINRRTGEEFIDANRPISGLLHIVEDDSAGMSAWTVGRHRPAIPVIDGLAIQRPERGALRQSFCYTAAFGASSVHVTISLDAGDAFLRYQAECQFRAVGGPGKGIPQLAFYLPLKEKRESFTYAAPLGPICRPPMTHDVPSQGFAFAEGEQGGPILLSAETYGFRCLPDAMGLTLLRAPFAPDAIPECCDHMLSWGVGLCVGEGALSPYAMLSAFRRCAFAFDAAAHDGTLSASGTLLAVEGNALLTGIKLAEDDSGHLILRLSETTGQDSEVTLRLPASLQRAWYADVHETPLDAPPPAQEGSVLHVKMPASAIVTLRIEI